MLLSRYAIGVSGAPMRLLTIGRDNGCWRSAFPSQWGRPHVWVWLGFLVSCTAPPPSADQSGSDSMGDTAHDLGGERPPVQPRVPEDVDGDGFDDVTDCQTLDAAIHPSALELPGNGVDENCDGFDRAVMTTNWTEVAVDWSTDDPALELGEDARVTTHFQRVPLHDGGEVVLGLAWPNPEPGKGLSLEEVMDIDTGESLVRTGSFMPIGDKRAASTVLEGRGQWDEVAFGIVPFSGAIGDVDGNGLPELMVNQWDRAEWDGLRLTWLSGSEAHTPPVSLAGEASCREGCWLGYRQYDTGTVWLALATPVEGPVLTWEQVGEVGCERDATHHAGWVQAGDVNGDGSVDLLVQSSLPGPDGFIGEVYFGPLSSDEVCRGADVQILTHDDGILITHPHTRGDLNGDGAEEVWVRISGRSPGDRLQASYAVFDISGRMGDIDLSEALFTVQPNRVDGSYIGQVEVGDWDGDSHVDLMVGAFPLLHPTREGAPSRGSVAMFRGPLSGNLYYDAADVVWSGPGFDDGFGAGFLLGDDWDGDGQQDLLVGAPFSSWDPDFRGKVWFTPFVVPPAE
jgi:hypothetical protein